jgi:hypothetical protein
MSNLRIGLLLSAQSETLDKQQLFSVGSNRFEKTETRDIVLVSRWIERVSCAETAAVTSHARLR